MNGRQKYTIHYLIPAVPVIVAVLIFLIHGNEKEKVSLSTVLGAIGFVCVSLAVVAGLAIHAEKQTRPKTLVIQGDGSLLAAVLGVELQMEGHRILTKQEGPTKIYEWTSSNPIRQRYHRWLAGPIAVTVISDGVLIYGPANMLEKLEIAGETVKDIRRV